KIPDTFTLVFFIVVAAAIATWFVPGGEFIRETKQTGNSQQETVIADSYHHVENTPQTWQIFAAFFNGFVKTSNIIVFIFIVGGAFQIFNHTKAIDTGVAAFLETMEKLQQRKLFKRINVNTWIIVCIMVMFSLFGAVFGMSEETIAFVIIFIPLAISMGYDSIVGVAMCYMAVHVGFAGAMFNPFTIGIAQGLAGLPAFSGLEYRTFCWIVFTTIGILFVLWYARKVKKNPQRSPMYELDNYWRQRKEVAKNDQTQQIKRTLSSWILWGVWMLFFIFLSIKYPQTRIAISDTAHSIPAIPALTLLFFVMGLITLRKGVRFFVLNLLLFTVLFLIVGVLGYQWYIMETATLFLVMGLSAGIACAISINRIFGLFLEGCKDILNAALVVGLAGGIIIILQDGKITDTILFAMSESMKNVGETGSLMMMYLFQNALNLIIPSGSAKAALTVPIMSQFADIVHISRQTMVLAFQFGDGITNMITPASGVLLGCLGVAKIPYTIWAKWVFRFLLLLFLVGFLLLWTTLLFPLNGF
ncbi:MAG: AbgT family transporter, partial [Bacteroidales bacterium]|nr:AbgT family transporter [Bacteroidales bacterium]